MSRVGIEDVRGYLAGGFSAWKKRGTASRENIPDLCP